MKNTTTSKAPSKALAPQIVRAPEAAVADSFQLGERVRALRVEKDMKLGDVADRAGLARSTLSKIENNRTSPTFEVLLKLAGGLGVAMDELLTPPRSKLPSGRWSMTRASQGQMYDTGAYSHEFLCADLTQKNIVPSKTRITARSISEFDGWIRHEGDDFLLVLEGAVELHTEFYQPMKLETGDSVYYDASMGHLCISVSKKDALVLWVACHH